MDGTTLASRISEKHRESIFRNIQMAAVIPAGASYLAATLVSPVIFNEVLVNGFNAPGPAQGFMTIAAGVAATSVAVSAIFNLDREDLKNAGVAVKNFGKALVDGVSDLGRSMGLIDKEQSPLSKIAEEPAKNRSYWATTAIDSARLMLISPIMFTTVTAVVGAMVVPFAGQGNYGAAAVAAGVMGAASAVSIGAQVGLGRIRKNLQADEKFASAAATAEPEKPSSGRSRSIDSDIGLQP